jgi:hypothetical protein
MNQDQTKQASEAEPAAAEPTFADAVQDVATMNARMQDQFVPTPVQAAINMLIVALQRAARELNQIKASAGPAGTEALAARIDAAEESFADMRDQLDSVDTVLAKTVTDVDTLTAAVQRLAPAPTPAPIAPPANAVELPPAQAPAPAPADQQ